MNPPEKTSSPGLSFLLSGWYPVIWIAFAVLLVYGKTTGFDFLNYDEQYLIVENKAFLADPASIVRVFFRDLGRQFTHFYRPALMLSFIADALLYGFNSFWYHITNILLHVSGSLLLYALLRRLACGQIRSFVCALFFAVHPMLVQAVAWVPGRNDSLLGIFVFSSFIMLVDYAERRRALSYLLHLAGLFLALLTKESAVSVFPVFAVYLFWVARDVPAAGRVKLLGGWALAALAYIFLYTHAIHYDQPFYERVFRYLPSLPAGLLGYLGKMLFPMNLSVFPFAADLSFAAGVPAAGIIALAVFLSRNGRMEKVWFGAAWTVLFFLPSLVLGWQGIFFEHRAYVPLAGLCIMAGHIRGGILDRLVSSYRRVLGAAVAAVLAVFVVLSLRYCDVFVDSESFWTNAAASSPRSFLAHKNLGVVYGQSGRFDLALASFKKAITMNDGDLGTRCFAADSLVLLGRKEEAEREFRDVLRLDPGHAEAKQKLLLLSRMK